MKLYIAGPMSGLPEMNYPAFNDAEKKLTLVQYETENPATNENPNDEDYIEWLRLGIKQLLICEGVAFLPGFGASKGAMLELHIANVLKMPIKSVDEWLVEAHYRQFPTDEDISGIESNPLCARCGHNRGVHEISIKDKPYGYCVSANDDFSDCDCTGFVSREE
jgi:hypothetical protein